MNVKVRFASSLRYLVGTPTLDLDLADGTAISGLFDVLADRIKETSPEGGRGRDLNELTRYVAILRNGEPVDQKQTAATLLAAGDVVDLVPPIAGGALSQ